MSKVVLISSVKGRSCQTLVHKLVATGHIVYVGLPPDGQAPADLPAAARPVIFDVTDENTVAMISKHILKAEGRIDHVFYTGCHNSFGAVELHDMHDAEHQFQINLFGAIRLVHAFAAVMRSVGGGGFTICSRGPIAAETAFAGWHNAGEAALASIIDTMRRELACFDVSVTQLTTGFASHYVKEIADVCMDYGAHAGSYLRHDDDNVDPLGLNRLTGMTAGEFVDAAMRSMTPSPYPFVAHVGGQETIRDAGLFRQIFDRLGFGGVAP